MFFMSSLFSFRCFTARQDLKVLERKFKPYLIFLSCFMWAKSLCLSFQVTMRRKRNVFSSISYYNNWYNWKKNIYKSWGVQAGPLSVKNHV